MSLRRTALLALAVILVGGFYYWYEVEGSKRRKAAEEEQLRVLEVKPEAVSALTLSRGDLTLKAARRDGQWYLTSPIETSGDQEALGRLVEAASEAKKIRVIDDKPQDLKPFGLEAPRFLLTLNSTQGDSTIAIGAASPTGRGVYARVGSEGPVVLLERDVERAADKGLFDFRDKRLFDAALADVVGLRITRGKESIVAEKTGKDRWVLKQPLEAPADSVAVEDLLRELTSGKVQEFRDHPKEDPKVFGLASPRVAITLSAADGRTLSTLNLGKEVKAKGEEAPATGRIYARKGEAGPVLLVEDKLTKALPTGAEALRDRRLLVYELDDVERLEAASAEETVVLERRGERDWVMTKPRAASADGSAVRSFLWELKALRAKDFLDRADPKEARFGLARPARSFLLNLKGQSEPLRLEVGGEVTGGAGSYVRASGQAGLVTVEAEGLKKIYVTRLDFMDRSLLSFKTEDASRLEVKSAKGHVELWKDGPVWQLVAPERHKLDLGLAESLLWSLRRLPFSGVREEKREGDPSGEVLLEVRLWTGSGEPKKLAVVKESGGAAGDLLAYSSARPGLYTVEAKELKEVERGVERLLNQ